MSCVCEYSTSFEYLATTTMVYGDSRGFTCMTTMDSQQQLESRSPLNGLAQQGLTFSSHKVILRWRSIDVSEVI